jgi:hypothetical protein
MLDCKALPPICVRIFAKHGRVVCDSDLALKLPTLTWVCVLMDWNQSDGRFTGASDDDFLSS